MISDNKWSSIILSLSELHLSSKGPLDELVNAIQDVLADLGVKLENAYAEFDR